MMRFYAGDLLIIGVTKGNIDRLVAGEPIFFDGERPAKAICIYYGETKPAILDEMQKHGLPVEPYMREAAERDPS